MDRDTLAAKPIIDPIPPALVEQELSQELFLRHTNNGGNRLYCFTAQQAPNAMREVGRLRELAFREAGGGTGLEIDIDEFDTCQKPYSQLVVWDPDQRLILGGYRYYICDATTNPATDLSTGHYFRFADAFVRNYIPYTIELGRSFVHPLYQTSNQRRKGIYALDNLWDGLGSLIVRNPRVRYYFGKVTMYPNYNIEARSALLHYLATYFPDPDGLVHPIEPLAPGLPESELAKLFVGNDFKADTQTLNAYLAERGERIPPLIKSYMGLSSTMRMFGTAINSDFGNVEETGILVRIADILPEKKARHME